MTIRPGDQAGSSYRIRSWGIRSAGAGDRSRWTTPAPAHLRRPARPSRATDHWPQTAIPRRTEERSIRPVTFEVAGTSCRLAPETSAALRRRHPNAHEGKFSPPSRLVKRPVPLAASRGCQRRYGAPEPQGAPKRGQPASATCGATGSSCHLALRPSHYRMAANAGQQPLSKTTALARPYAQNAGPPRSIDWNADLGHGGQSCLRMRHDIIEEQSKMAPRILHHGGVILTLLPGMTLMMRRTESGLEEYRRLAVATIDPNGNCGTTSRAGWPPHILPGSAPRSRPPAARHGCCRSPVPRSRCRAKPSHRRSFRG